MGTAKIIRKFWSPFINDKSIENDDQIYATNVCINKKDIRVYIDINYDIFYNYSHGDEELIKIINNKLYLSENNILVLSGPGKGKLENILKELGIKLEKTKKENPKFITEIVLSSIYKHHHNFIFEILFITLLIYSIFGSSIIMKKHFLTISFRKWLYIILFISFTTYIEYVAFIRNVQISIFDKSLYLGMDFFHMFIVFISYLLVYLIFSQKNKINYLLILNIKYLIVLLLFFIYKKCILTMFSSKIVKTDIRFAPLYNRFMYLFDLDYNYDQTMNKEDSLHAWINGNKFLVGVLIITNIYVLLYVNRKLINKIL